MGLNVQSDWVSTSYLVDAKATGGGQAGLNQNGAITVLTIVDPSTGAEIKIADTNGNGAIEIEELFMNELLSGISKTIDTSNFKAAIRGTTISSVEDARAEAEKLKEEESKKEEDNRKTISSSDKSKIIDKLKQQFIESGYSVAAAYSKATEIVESNYVVSSGAESMKDDAMQLAITKLSTK